MSALYLFLDGGTTCLSCSSVESVIYCTHLERCGNNEVLLIYFLSSFRTCYYYTVSIKPCRKKTNTNT